MGYVYVYILILIISDNKDYIIIMSTYTTHCKTLYNSFTIHSSVISCGSQPPVQWNRLGRAGRPDKFHSQSLGVWFEKSPSRLSQSLRGWFAWKLRITVILESSTFKNIIVWSTIHLPALYVIYFDMFTATQFWQQKVEVCRGPYHWKGWDSQPAHGNSSKNTHIPREIEKWMIKPLTHWQFPSPKTCLKIEESCETKAVKTC